MVLGLEPGYDCCQKTEVAQQEWHCPVVVAWRRSPVDLQTVAAETEAAAKT